MKHVLKGWLALAVFVAAVCYVGINLLLNRYLTRGLMILLFAAVAVVVLLNWKSGDQGDPTQEIPLDEIE